MKPRNKWNRTGSNKNYDPLTEIKKIYYFTNRAL